MCEPISAMSAASQVMLAVSAASAVVGYVETANAAKKQEDSARQGWDAYTKQFALQQEQINDKATADMSDRAREALVEQARLSVIGAESGIGGLSNERLMNASKFSEGSDIARLEGNRSRAQMQAAAEAGSAHAATQSRLNAIKQPSLLGAGLQIAGAYAGASVETQRVRAITAAKPVPTTR